MCCCSARAARTPELARHYRVHLVARPRRTWNRAKAPERSIVPRRRNQRRFRSQTPQNTDLARDPARESRSDATRRAANRATTSQNQPLPGEKPSNGQRLFATVEHRGRRVSVPEYLQNIVSQVLRQWPRPAQSTSARGEVLVLIHRDGSVTDLQFIRRSGNFTSISRLKEPSKRLSGLSAHCPADGRLTCFLCGSISRGQRQ